MWKVIDFLEKHKFGILIAVATYIAMFMYFNADTYTRTYDEERWPQQTDIEQEIEIKPEQIEQQAVNLNNNNGPLKSFASDVNDQREKSKDDYSRNKDARSSEQRIKDLEKQFYAESGGSQKREQIRKEMDALKEQQKNAQSSKSDNKQTNTSGGDKAYAGRTMVNWELKGRTPHQGNEWYVRNPGYTCGKGQSGIVYIKIKVDQNGNVLSATYVPSMSSNATACMIEQAKKYAQISRFAYSSSASSSQEGWISYEFVAG